MGQIYYDMGFLSSTEVIECSSTDLVGQYIGQTGPKTQKLFEKALGRVLFIDEAYRLADGHYAKEAMDEVVGLLTQEKFKSKMVVILAGYDNEMNQLLSVNTGLSSRFPDTIQFTNMAPQNCFDLTQQTLRKRGIQLLTTAEEEMRMKSLFEALARQLSWGNARDVGTLSKSMVVRVFAAMVDSSEPDMKLKGADAIACMESMLEERTNRTSSPMKRLRTSMSDLVRTAQPPAPVPPTIITATSTDARAADTSSLPPSRPASSGDDDPRDPGVSDSVWSQLQSDKKAAALAAQEAARIQKELQEQVRQAEEEERQRRRALEEAEQAEAKAKAAEVAEMKRKLERARLQEVEAREKRERIAAELEAKRKAEEGRRQQEAKVQAKLRTMGVCVAGFRWIKTNGGYRCAGGVHFVSDGQLGL